MLISNTFPTYHSPVTLAFQTLISSSDTCCTFRITR